MAPATRFAVKAAATITQQDESDYGSEVDEEALTAIIAQAESQPALLIESIEEYNPLPRAARLPTTRIARSSPSSASQGRVTRQYVDEDSIAFQVYRRDGPIREPSIEVEYDESNRVAFSPRNPTPRDRKRSVSLQPEEPQDGRSPLERFRTAPKKPMSVTDIISPAWCELQYWYSLTKYGRVRKTPAMRQGSSVHKVLEEQVHTTVPVEVETREDRFGLRLWNIIQGLRTLRATGMTRELEVWGIIEGQVVIGIIDELSYDCPDDELEAKALQQSGNKKDVPLPSDQTTMEAFFVNPKQNSQNEFSGAWLGTPNAPPRKVYLTDVKTRGSRSIPTNEASLRPTYMQLMMYHRLLSSLATNTVPADQVFARYDVDGTVAFSDMFIAQIGGLEFNFNDAVPSQGGAPPDGSQDSIDELLSHNSLEKLWSLMMEEFAQTMPAPKSKGQGPETPLGSVLRAEYRKPGTGDIIGSKTFAFDAATLDSYVRQEMAWWKGERETKGVNLDEAFKCGFCEFAEGCTWRNGKVEEGLKKARLRKEDRRRSEA